MIRSVLVCTRTPWEFNMLCILIFLSGLLIVEACDILVSASLYTQSIVHIRVQYKSKLLLGQNGQSNINLIGHM